MSEKEKMSGSSHGFPSIPSFSFHGRKGSQSSNSGENEDDDQKSDRYSGKIKSKIKDIFHTSSSKQNVIVAMTPSNAPVRNEQGEEPSLLPDDQRKVSQYPTEEDGGAGQQYPTEEDGGFDETDTITAVVVETDDGGDGAIAAPAGVDDGARIAQSLDIIEQAAKKDAAASAAAATAAAKGGAGADSDIIIDDPDIISGPGAAAGGGSGGGGGAKSPKSQSPKAASSSSPKSSSPATGGGSANVIVSSPHRPAASSSPAKSISSSEKPPPSPRSSTFMKGSSGSPARKEPPPAGLKKEGSKGSKMGSSMGRMFGKVSKAVVAVTDLSGDKESGAQKRGSVGGKAGGGAASTGDDAADSGGSGLKEGSVAIGTKPSKSAATGPGLVQQTKTQSKALKHQIGLLGVKDKLEDAEQILRQRGFTVKVMTVLHQPPPVPPPVPTPPPTTTTPAAPALESATGPDKAAITDKENEAGSADTRTTAAGAAAGDGGGEAAKKEQRADTGEEVKEEDAGEKEEGDKEEEEEMPAVPEGPPPILSLCLGLGPKLLHKLALELDMPKKRAYEYSEKDRAILAGEAIKIIKRTDLQYDDVILLHNREALMRLATPTTGRLVTQPDAIAEYFGSGVALYFAWLKFYTRALLVPGFAGVVLFVKQVVADDVDIPFVPLYCILISMWSSVWLIYWKRENASIALKWGLHDDEGDAVLIAGANMEDSAVRAKQKAVAGVKFAITVPIMLAAIVFVIKAMLYCITLSDNANKLYGDSMMRHWPTVVYSVVPLVCSTLYAYLAQWLNDYEGHSTAHKRRKHLTIKLFAFQFINSYVALFYVCFWLRDMDRLRGMLLSLMVTKQIVGSVLEVAIPYASKAFTHYMAVRQHKKQAQLMAAAGALATSTPIAPKDYKTTAVGVGDVVPSKEEVATGKAVVKAGGSYTASTAAAAGADGYGVSSDDSEELTEEEKEEKKSFLSDVESAPFEIESDYLEMVIQFGYCAMFAVAFPLAPVLAFINNVVEYRLDLGKLIFSRRPLVTRAPNIGGWMTCLQVIAFMATLTNCCIVALVSKRVNNYLPDQWTEVMGPATTFEQKLLLAILLEHLLLFLQYLISGLIPDTPLWVKDTLAKMELRKMEERRVLRLEANQMKAHKGGDGGGDGGGGGGGGGNYGSKSLSAREEMAKARKEAAVLQLKELQLEQRAWSFSPKWYAPLVMIPYAVGYCELNMLWVMPLSLAVLSYLQNMKDKADIGVALGIVTDTSLLKLVQKELPAWFYDSEVERAEWINKLLDKIWGKASDALKVLVEETIQPILDQYKPPGITALDIKKVFLGSHAPSVSSVRTVQALNAVSVDMEIKWAGNSLFTIDVGRKGLPLTIEISDLHLSAHLRIELNPLVGRIPCFGNLAITFMSKPHVDFALKIAKLDLMSLGPAELSIGDAVSGIIKSVISNIALYPKRIVIPIIEDDSLKLLATPPPVGLLIAHLVGANDLMAKDKNVTKADSSDPYVKITLGEQELRSETIKESLNPRWGRDFDFMVHDPGAQKIYFELFDQDWTTGLIKSNDEFLGRCELPLSMLQPGTPLAIPLTLQDANKGQLLVKLTYVPLQTDDDDDEDIVVDAQGDSLTNEVVESEGAPVSDKEHAKKMAAVVHTAMGDSRRRSSVATSMLKGAVDDIRHMGVLSISNIHVSGLNVNKVFVEFTLGEAKRKTETTVRPVAVNDFPENFHIISRGARNAMLQVEVKAENTSGLTSPLGSVSTLGQIIIPLEEVMRNENELERAWGLTGDRAVGHVKCMLKFSPAKLRR